MFSLKYEYSAHYDASLQDLYYELCSVMEARLMILGQTRQGWKTFFPLIPTTLVPILRPLVIWPMVDLRTPPPQTLLTPKEDRTITRERLPQIGTFYIFFIK